MLTCSGSCSFYPHHKNGFDPHHSKKNSKLPPGVKPDPCPSLLSDQNWNEEVFESHDDDDGKSGEKENVDALKGLNDDEAIHVIEANNVTEARRECKRLLEEKTTLEKRLQEVEEKNERVQEENKRLKVTLGVKEDEVKRLKADNETLGFESKHLEDRIAVNNRELRLHRGTEAELMDANSQLEAELRDFKDNLNATKELLDEQTKGNRDLKLNVEGKTAELNRLNELISRFELEQAEMDEINCNLEEQKMHLTEKLKLKEVEIDEFLEENSTLKEKLNFHLIIQDKQDVMNASFTEWNKLNRRRSSGMFDLIKNSTAINAADCPNLGDEMASVQHGVQTQDRGVMTAHDEILVLNNNNTDDINNNNDINNNDNVDREEKVVKKLGKLSFAVFLSFLTFCFFFGSLEFDDRIVKPAGFVWLSQWLEIPPVVIYAERTEFAPVW